MVATLPPKMVSGMIRPLHYQNWLHQQGHALLTAQQLADPLPTLDQANRWEVLLYDLITQWQESQGEQALSAHYFLQFLYEYLSEQRRQIRFGKGVLLSTVHGVKGEEYHHVLILDGGWQRCAESAANNIEEERRLFYVAMTRAIQRLVVMSRADQRHPHLPLITERCYNESSQATAPARLRRFAIMGMRQLDIGYAGRSNENHPIHQNLRQLHVGDAVRIDLDKLQKLHVFHGQNPVARLSQSAHQTWLNQFATIRHANVIAMIERSKEQEDDAYQEQVRSERWELPIIELEL